MLIQNYGLDMICPGKHPTTDEEFDQIYEHVAKWIRLTDPRKYAEMIQQDEQALAAMVRVKAMLCGTKE